MPYKMDLDVGMKCIKYMLLVANFMFVMIGFLLISIGTTIEAIYSDFELFMETRYFSPAALCVAIGIIIFFVSLLGCLGAFKESTCLVKLYAVCLTIVLILEISASIAAYSMRRNLTTTLKSNMEYSMDAYMQNSTYDQTGWDFMQKQLYCCGVNNADDWTSKNNFSIPSSCYNCESCTERENLFKSGCLPRLSYVVSECALLLGVGALCVSLIQILGIIFANMLAKSIRRIKTEILVQREDNRQKIYKQWQENNPKSPVLNVSGSSEA